MGCPCSEITYITPTTNCGTCGYNCTSCVCPSDPIVMPEVTCEDPNPCNELFPIECIKYTGDDIKCSTEASILYPNSTHIVATDGDMLPTILNNINNQLCYLFSSDYILQFLSNITNDSELSDIICNIIAINCPSSGDLICPTVSKVDYKYNSSTLQYYLESQINYVPFATSYSYQFYTESTANSGTFDVIIGSGTITQPSVALPITFSVSISNSTTYPSTNNYAVLIEALDSTLAHAASGVTPVSSFDYATVAAANPGNCGINKYTPQDSSLSCHLLSLDGLIKANPNMQFSFTKEPSNVNYYPVTNYIVHWYLQSQNTPYVYNYAGKETILYSSASTPIVVNLTKSFYCSFTKSSTTVTVTNNNHGMSNGDSITINTAVGTPPTYTVPIGTYTISGVTTNTFNITVTSGGASSGTLTYITNIVPTDKVVVMIYTITDYHDCYKGVADRQNGSFSQNEITQLFTNPTANNVFKNF